MRILHTMLRVGDLQRSIGFYTGVLGMTVLRTTDRPEQKYTLAFVGYGDEAKHAVLELTYNYGVDRYDLGTGYGHIAIEVPDAAAACSASTHPPAIACPFTAATTGRGSSKMRCMVREKPDMKEPIARSSSASSAPSTRKTRNFSPTPRSRNS